MALTLYEQSLYFLIVAPICFYLTIWFYEKKRKEINVRLAIFSWLFGVVLWMIFYFTNILR